jgi:Skp family chaperone for outer membrane proteins
MKIYKTIILLPLVAVMSSPVMAHYGHDGYFKFDQRIERQQKRIKKGVLHAELTKKEAKKLRKQHRNIKKLKRQFQKDGLLIRHERKTLQRELDLASKRIYRFKHNNHNRYDGSNEHKKKRSTGHSRYHDYDRSARLNYRDYY